jgi:hypothetical protein
VAFSSGKIVRTGHNMVSQLFRLLDHTRFRAEFPMAHGRIFLRPIKTLSQSTARSHRSFDRATGKSPPYRASALGASSASCWRRQRVGRTRPASRLRAPLRIADASCTKRWQRRPLTMKKVLLARCRPHKAASAGLIQPDAPAALFAI